MDLKTIILKYVKLHLNYRLGSQIKLKHLYKHFIENNQNFIIPYEIFRETCDFVFHKLNRNISSNERIVILQLNNTYVVVNLDFRTKAPASEACFLELTKSFYGLPTINQETK